MRTKEEILGRNIHRSTVLDAMQEYADEYSKEMACGFAEWIFKQPKYTIKSNSPIILYQIYLEHLNK